MVRDSSSVPNNCREFVELGAVGLFIGLFVLPPAVEEEHNKGADDDN